MNSLGFDRICRTCMAESVALVSIFDRQSSVNDETTIGGMLRLFTTIAAYPMDGLPQRICITCISEINSAVSFKQKCERSERTLQSCLQQMPALEPHSPCKDEEPNINETTCNESELNIIIYNEMDGKSVQSNDIVDDMTEYDPTAVDEADFLDNMDEPEDAEYIDEEEVLSERDSKPRSPETADECNVHRAIDDTDPNVHQPAEAEDQLDSMDDETDDYTLISIRQTLIQPPMAADGQPHAAFQCPKCSAMFVNERSLSIHQKTNKCTIHTFECPACQRVFIHRSNLRAHMQQQHSAGMTERTCADCSRCFDTVDALDEHQRDGQCGNRLYRCTHCTKAFTMLSSLRDHVRTHTGERPFLCSICGKRFTQKTNLRQHMLRHAQTKSFQCAQCPKTFVSKGELGQHTLSHTGVHPFACKECDAEFTTSSSLVKHRRIHTGERPYACEYCPMRFAALGTLKNHRRTHTGEKPFQCGQCPKSFRQRSDCVAHQRIHDGPGVVRLQCKYCARSFARSSALKVHEQKHRADDDTTANGKSESNTIALLESEAEKDKDIDTANEP